MNLAFQNNTVWLIGLPIGTALLFWFVYSQRRQGLRWRQIAVTGGLRAIALLLLLALAARPIWKAPEDENPPRKYVALLVDRSESMSLRDHELSHFQQAIEFARTGLLPAVQDIDVEVEPFLFAADAELSDGGKLATATPDGKQTNLARAIVRSIVETENPPIAVVALTDGITNEDGDNARAISALLENHVPFVGIGFGQETGTRILTLERVVAPSVASPKQQFRVSARLRATGEGELPRFDLLLLRDGQFVEKKTVNAGPGARVWQESFHVRESDEKLHRYSVQLLPPNDESLKCPNTESSVAVRIADEKELRVLFLQGGLTWDYKFIRLALMDDPTVKLSGLSRTASQSDFFQNVDNAAELVGGFPSTIEELSAFRVVVLANLRSGDLTRQQQELLSQFCREYGGGVLMIGGAKTFDASWKRSRLEQLLPVRFATLPGRARNSRPFRLRITDSALEHPVFQVTDDGTSRDVWNSLPTFTQYAHVESAKPGAQIWAVHPDAVSADDQRVLMAVQRYGAGLSGVICVQNFWRWRLAKESNTDHFDRFWRQLLRHLAEGGQKTLAIRLPDQQLQPNANIRVVVERRPDASAIDTVVVQYDVKVTDEDKDVVAEHSIALAPDQSSEFSFIVDESGLYTISATDAGNVIHATRSIEINDIDQEFLYTARSMENLRQWASLSDGIAVRAEDCSDPGELIEQLRATIEGTKRQKEIHQPAGINGWMLALLLGCLCLEWAYRKRWGLV